MRPSRIAILALLLVVTAGCAAPAADPRLVMASVPCLPPGVTAEFFSWPVVELQTLTLHSEDGRDIEGTWVLYQKQSRSVSVVWTKSDLIALDPKPQTDEPYWIDGSLVTDDDDNMLRATPDGLCRWRRPKESA